MARLLYLAAKDSARDRLTLATGIIHRRRQGVGPKSSRTVALGRVLAPLVDPSRRPVHQEFKHATGLPDIDPAVESIGSDEMKKSAIFVRNFGMIAHIPGPRRHPAFRRVSHEDVLAGAERFPRQGVVLGGGRGDRHGRGCRLRENRRPVERRDAVPLGLLVCLGVIGVADRRQRAQFGERSDRIPAPVAAAGDADRWGPRLDDGAVRRLLDRRS